jgi:outer membrane protein
MAKAIFVIAAIGSSLALARTAVEKQNRAITSDGKSFEECYEAALKRSDDVAVDGELIKQAEDVYRQAIGAVLPNISGSGTYQYQQNNAGTFSNFYPNPSTSTKLTLTQPLFEGLKEYAGLRQTKTLIHASEFDKQQAATQLYEDTAASYFAVVSLEQDIDNVKDELAYYDRRIGELRQFVAIGRSQTTDILTAQSQQAALLAQLKQVEGQLAAQRAVLAFLTAFPTDVPVRRPPDDDAAIRPLTEYLDRVRQRPDVKAAMERAHAAEDQITIARAGHFPTLGLQADYFLERTGPLSNVNWDAMLILTVPLFAGGTVVAQVDQASSVRDQADFATSKANRLAVQQVRQFFENFNGDRNQYHAFKTATELAEKNYEEEVKNFRRGLVTNLDVLTALTTFEESKRSTDKARFAMLQDYADVEAAGAFRPEPVSKR